MSSQFCFYLGVSVKRSGSVETGTAAEQITFMRARSISSSLPSPLRFVYSYSASPAFLLIAW
eukprot:2358456-Pyramimonas_sp.AAC.1